MGRKSGSRTHS